MNLMWVGVWVGGLGNFVTVGLSSVIFDIKIKR